MSALRIGFACADITPPAGLPLGGYAARLAPAVGALDPLFCRAVVFDGGKARAGIIVLDLVHVSGQWTARVRERVAARAGIVPDRLLVAATHTHAGPGVFRSALVRDDRLIAYEDDLVSVAAECVCRAAMAVAPAALSFGTAPAQGVAANRRDPSAHIDDTVRVLCARTPAGQLLGTFATFACHSTVLSARNDKYSGDLFGAAATMAAADLGVPVVLANGAGADVSTRFTRREQSYGEVCRLGRALADALCAAVRQARPAANGDGAPVASASCGVEVDWRSLPSADDAAAALRAAHTQLEVLRARGADPRILRLAAAKLEGAQAQLWISSQGGWEAFVGPRAPRAEVQALRCGAIRIVTAPGELFSASGEAVRRAIGAHTLLLGYANDYLGYFLPCAEARAGGYEALIAMVEPECEERIQTAMIQTARSLAD